VLIQHDEGPVATAVLDLIYPAVALTGTEDIRA
jgi:hypothetical protein